LTHVPTDPETLQASHAPAQPVLQQTPSTQLPLVHWLAPEHALPLASLAMQLVPLHQSPTTQFASTLHEDGHEALPPLHTKGAHDGLPADPPATLTHVPTDPETLHASHAPLQAALQQTPSTQLPLVHELLLLHATPLASFGMHEEPLQ
jgi:hypothetical protein